MDSRQLSDFKRLVENSREITLVPCLSTKGESLLASLALFFSLDNFNRKTSLLLGSLPSSLVTLDSANSWQNKPTIVIDRPSGEKISQMRYEKNNGRVYLHFNSHDVPLQKEDVTISFSPLKSEPDLFICLGFADPAEIIHPAFQQRNPQSRVVNIDHHPENRIFGQVNLTDPDSTLIELTTQAIESLHEDLIDRRVGAYLLKGLKLYALPRNFSNETCRRIAQLVNQKALLYTPNPCTTEDVGQLAMLEKAINCLNFYAHKNLAVLTMPYREFRNISREDFVFIVDELRSRLLELGNLLIIWQRNNNKVQGVVYLEEKEKLEQIMAAYPGNYQQGRGVFSVKVNDLGIAKSQLVNYFLSL